MLKTRRQFIRNMLVTPALGGMLISNPFGLNIASAQAAAGALGKTLVVIFQRGGCDGLHMVVPHGEAAYYSARGKSIAIQPPGTNARSALDLDGFFGLNPSMTAMHEIYNQGNMAIMPTVSWKNTNRSHFLNQAAIESGGNISARQGWLNLHLQQTERDVPLRAINFGGLQQSMRGDYSVSTLSNLYSLGLGKPNYEQMNEFLGVELKKYMESVYALDPEQGTSRELLYQHGRQLLTDLDVLGDIDPDLYQVANSAVYPDSTLGMQLKNTAQLLKSNLGGEIVTIGTGGWDSHKSQGGAQANGALTSNLEDFSDSIGAFYRDMGDKMDDVLILTMSEFGRSLMPNASGGTDHGHAASWLVLGNTVNGGIYGEWPGLEADQLNHGRYLSDTVDFRNIMSEVLINHLKNSNIEATIPNFTNYQPLGFMS